MDNCIGRLRQKRKPVPKWHNILTRQDRNTARDSHRESGLIFKATTNPLPSKVRLTKILVFMAWANQKDFQIFLAEKLAKFSFRSFHIPMDKF